MSERQRIHNYTRTTKVATLHMVLLNLLTISLILSCAKITKGKTKPIDEISEKDIANYAEEMGFRIEYMYQSETIR